MTSAPTTRQLACSLALPAGFRPGDILAFHRRDPLELAERVDDGTLSLHKGIVWHDAAACLSVRFLAARAEARLDLDAPVAQDLQPAFESWLRRMLGLEQDIAAFEASHREHPRLGPLLARQAGLRVPLAASPFEALTWAITGQQISVGAAVALRRKLIQLADLRHSGGLLCYPQASHVAALDEPALRQAGFSATKSRALLTLSRLVVAGELPLEDWMQSLPVDEIRARLEAVHGIGPWTVNYALLRGFGWLDGSLHGDAAVRRGLQALLERPDRMDAEETRLWLEAFSPWRALVGAHLWAMQSATAY